MATLSIPLTNNLEEFVNSLVKSGAAPNKAEVVRKPLRLLAEEEAIWTVLKSEQEVRDGKALKGNLHALVKKLS